MNTDSRKNAKLSQSAHQQLTTLSEATNMPITKIIDEFTDALRLNKTTIKLMIARGGRFNINEALTAGIEAQAYAADRAYYRRQAEAAQLKEVKPELKLQSIPQLIKENVSSCNHWDDLLNIIKTTYPDYQFDNPANCQTFFNQPYYYNSQLVQSATRNRFYIEGVTGLVKEVE